MTRNAPEQRQARWLAWAWTGVVLGTLASGGANEVHATPASAVLELCLPAGSPPELIRRLAAGMPMVRVVPRRGECPPSAVGHYRGRWGEQGREQGREQRHTVIFELQTPTGDRLTRRVPGAVIDRPLVSLAEAGRLGALAVMVEGLLLEDRLVATMETPAAETPAEAPPAEAPRRRARRPRRVVKQAPEPPIESPAVRLPALDPLPPPEGPAPPPEPPPLLALADPEPAPEPAVAPTPPAGEITAPVEPEPPTPWITQGVVGTRWRSPGPVSPELGVALERGALTLSLTGQPMTDWRWRGRELEANALILASAWAPAWWRRGGWRLDTPVGLVGAQHQIARLDVEGAQRRTLITVGFTGGLRLTWRWRGLFTGLSIDGRAMALAPEVAIPDGPETHYSRWAAGAAFSLGWRWR